MDRPRKSKDKPQGSTASPSVRRSSSTRSSGQRTPGRRNSGTPRRKAVQASVPSMDRVGMLIMEANEISQYLHRDYVFARTSDDPTSDDEVEVKVTNTKLSLSCRWSLIKLKERLVRMRKLMYAGDAAMMGFGGESVFFDPKDVWVNDEQEIFISGQNGLTNGHPGSGAGLTESPRPAAQDKPSPGTQGAKQPIQPMPNGTVVPPVEPPRRESPLMRSLSDTTELPGDSKFLRASLTSIDSTTGSALPEKYLISSGYIKGVGVLNDSATKAPSAVTSSTSATRSALDDLESPDLESPVRPSKAPQSIQSHSQPVKHAKWTVVTPKPIKMKPQPRPTAVLALCRDLMGLTLTRIEGPAQTCKAVERIVCNCESVKLSVINILSAYIQALESVSPDIKSFADSELVRVTSLQLMAAMELLVSHVQLWSLVLNEMDSATIQQLTRGIQASVKELGSHMVTFLQGCEKEDDAIAQDSAAKILEVICELVQNCGELALATDLQSEVLLTDIGKTSSRDDDLLTVKAGTDLKQAFLIGCDTFVERSLSAAVKTLEQCEAEVATLTEECSTDAQLAHDVVKHVDIVIATCKILLLKCQEVQVELNACMKDDGDKQPDYFQHYFVRCGAVVNQVNTLVDSVSLLLQATDPLLDDSEPGTLLKVIRCGEMVQRSTNKLTGASNTETSLSLTSNTADSLTSTGVNSLDLPYSSVLSAEQKEQLTNAGQDIRLAVHALVELVRKNLPQGVAGAPSQTKPKRMLPATPGHPLVRCHSARSAQHRISRNIALVDYGGATNDNG